MPLSPRWAGVWRVVPPPPGRAGVWRIMPLPPGRAGVRRVARPPPGRAGIRAASHGAAVEALKLGSLIYGCKGPLLQCTAMLSILSPRLVVPCPCPPVVPRSPRRACVGGVMPRSPRQAGVGRVVPRPPRRRGVAGRPRRRPPPPVLLPPVKALLALRQQPQALRLLWVGNHRLVCTEQRVVGGFGSRCA